MKAALPEEDQMLIIRRLQQVRGIPRPWCRSMHAACYSHMISQATWHPLPHLTERLRMYPHNCKG